MLQVSCGRLRQERQTKPQRNGIVTQMLFEVGLVDLLTATGIPTRGGEKIRPATVDKKINPVEPPMWKLLTECGWSLLGLMSTSTITMTPCRQTLGRWLLKQI